MKITNINQTSIKNCAIHDSDKNKIINEKYIELESEQELNIVFGQVNFFQNILQYLSDGYMLESLIDFGVTTEEIRMFEKYLEANNLSIQNAIAINKYSNGSNMILSLKKGIYSKEAVQKGIMNDLFNKLMERRYIRYNYYK